MKLFQKLCSFIQEKTHVNVTKETYKESRQSEARRANQDQPVMSNDGEICFGHSKLSGRPHRFSSVGLSQVGASCDHAVLGNQYALEQIDQALGLCRGLRSSGYFFAKKPLHPQGCSSVNASQDVSKDVSKEVGFKNPKPLLNPCEFPATNIFDTRTLLVMPKPVFEQAEFGAYNPFQELKRAHWVAVEDEEAAKASTVKDAVDTPSIVQPEPLDELPPVFEDESYGDAYEDGFVAEDSFVAEDGTKVYISQPDDSDELEAELMAA